jgi:NAD(P)-dependent dehydrogenase (short-subunit alcohol dehydrogenase family)
VRRVAHRPEMRRVLITGATSGIGLRAARSLIEAGHHVTFAVRRQDHAAKLIGDNGWEARASIEGVDLSSLRSALALAQRVEAMDAVICNAGLQIPSGRQVSEDGYELTFAVNHLSHFAIAHEMISRGSPPRRFVFLGSGTHHPSDPLATRFGFRGGRYTNLDEVSRGCASKGESAGQLGRDRYATSKFCNIVTAIEITRRFGSRGVDGVVLDPGLAPRTGLAREQPLPIRSLYRAVAPLISLLPGCSTPERSGASVAWIAQQNFGGGRCFDYRRREITPWERCEDADIGEELWAGSLELCDRARPSHG